MYFQLELRYLFILKNSSITLRYLRLFSFLILAFSSYASQAQTWQLIMDLVVTDEGRKLEGAEVSVIQNGSTVKTYTTDSKGQIDVPIPQDGIYILDVTYPGFIHKKLEIDTRNVNQEEVGDEEIYYRADVELFPKIEGLNLDILDEPIGQIWYDSEFGGFTYNREYTLSKQAALAELKENYLKKKEEEAERQEEIKKQYEEAIKKADNAFKNGKWEEAKQYYLKAQELDPSNTYPSFQLGEISSNLIEKNANQEKYESAISSADAAFASKDYKEALEHYKTAKSYKPEDEYALSKIAEVQQLAVQAAKTQQDYLAAIERGDKALLANEVETAKAAFLEAQKLKPEEQYPSSKLAEINNIQSKEKQLELDYQNAITSAEESLAAKDYESAKASFSKASQLKPTETYPKEKITEIDALLAKAAQKEQDYVAAITEADNALSAKKYEEAITAYERAAAIKPEEGYPKSKISEIEAFIASNAEKEQQYKQSIQAGDEAMASKQWETARASYSKALELKPNETYPQSKITEINQLVAANEAKEEGYNKAIASADQAFAAEEYKEAKKYYEQALGYKASESYPQTKIAEIEKKLTAIAAQEEAAKLEKEKMAQLEADYQAAIVKADALLEEKSWDEATNAYNEALSLKPNESYPNQQLQEIQRQKKEQLAEMKKEELQDAYEETVSKADQAFAEKNYELAKASYEKALQIKSDESYPTEQLSEIDRIEQKLAEKEKAVAAQAVEQQYQAALQKADAEFEANDFEEAKKSYSAALAIKADEQYPKNQLAAIEAKLDSLQQAKAAEELAKEKEAKIQTDYLAAIALADRAFENKDYESARTNYQASLQIKPEETYPKEKLAEIDGILSQQAEKKAEMEQLAAQQQELEDKYNSLIESGEEDIAANNLQAALSNFQEASDLKPSEAYAKSKIEEIRQLLAEQKAAAAEEHKQEEIEAQKQMDYLAAITEADKFYTEKNWEPALQQYQAASKIKPSETYPQQQIETIHLIMSKEKQLAEAAEKAEQEKEQQVSEEKMSRQANKPVSTISGETEEEIDQMYKEIWEEKKSGKESYFSELKEQFQENNVELRREEEERKKNAIERLEEIAISYEKTVKQSTRLNKQNYETVKNNQKIYRDSQKELEIADQRAREKNWDIYQDLQDDIQQSNKEVAERNTNLYTEDLKERSENHQENIQRYRAGQQRSREQRNALFVSQAEEISEYNTKLKEKFEEENKNSIQEVKEGHRENLKRYSENQQDIRERRSAEYVDMAEELNENRKQLREKFERENKNRLEEVKDYHQEYTTEYIKNQEAAIATVNDQLEAQAEFIKKEGREQQESIEVKAQALKYRKEELSNMESRRISSSSRRINENSGTEYYTGASKQRKDSLASRYPEGISEEVIENQNGSTTIKRVVVEGSQADVYSKTLHNWGGVFYTKNGRNITKETWERETE